MSKVSFETIAVTSCYMVVIVVGGLLYISTKIKLQLQSQPLSTQTTPVVNSAYAVLSPATVPSKTVECVKV